MSKSSVFKCAFRQDTGLVGQSLEIGEEVLHPSRYVLHVIEDCGPRFCKCKSNDGVKMIAKSRLERPEK